MAGLVGLIASIAALDSLNPSTVGPALVLALGRHPRRDVAGFAAGVFGVSTLGGLALLFGPGHGLLARVAKPSAHTQHLAEAATGAALLAAAVALWLLRERVRHRLSSPRAAGGRSALALGATIMAVELPTAFPYFAGLIAIVVSRRGIVTQVALVLLYDIVFVAPLVLLLLMVTVGGQSAARFTGGARRAIDARAPTIGPVALGAVGVALLAFGASRL